MTISTVFYVNKVRLSNSDTMLRKKNFFNWRICFEAKFYLFFVQNMYYIERCD